MLGGRRALYLSVKFSSTVQEGLADVMHAICVTSRVLQAGKGPAANLEGTVETACHICCGHREWTVSRGARVASLGITAHSLSSLHKGCQGFRRQNAANKRGFFGFFFFFTDFDDSQKAYSHSGANNDLTVRSDPLHLGEDSDNIWHECTFVLARTFSSTVWFFSAKLG